MKYIVKDWSKENSLFLTGDEKDSIRLLDLNGRIFLTETLDGETTLSDHHLTTRQLIETIETALRKKAKGKW